MKELLKVEGLGKRFGAGCPHCGDGPAAADGNRCPSCGSVWACFDVSLHLMPGEILGVVGESGSGKSTLLRTLCFDQGATRGAAYLSCHENGTADMFQASSQRRRHIRDQYLGMVYQNPAEGLRMNFTSGGNVAEKLIAAGSRHVGTMRGRASELLARVEVPVARMDEPPRNFSGGMQQRVQIAKALANNPPLLLLDEVTTGLDLPVQARVLDLIREIQRDLGVAMLVISHDIGVIRMLADRTMVMLHGRVVESGLTDQILEDPQHWYSQLLAHSLL